MHYLIYPKDVRVLSLINSETKKPETESFINLLRTAWLGSTETSDSEVDVKMGMQISKLFRLDEEEAVDPKTKDKIPHFKAGDIIPFEDEEYEWLKKLVKGFKYHPGIKSYLLPLINAFYTAPKEKPGTAAEVSAAKDAAKVTTDERVEAEAEA
jgi:hypothetical protein